MLLKRKTIISVLLFSIFIFSNVYHGLEEKNLIDEVIKIGGDNNYPPYEFVDKSGNYKGFNVDIMRAVAIELGIEIELIPMSWERAIYSLKQGKIDAIQGMTITPLREEMFDFTQELVTNSQNIFVMKNTSHITDLEDLAGVKVSFQTGDVTDEILAKVPDIIPIEKENQMEALESLFKGEVEAFMGNRLTGIYYIQKKGFTENVKIVGEPMYVTQYSSAVKKDNKELLTLLNTGIEAIKKNGTYDKIYKKWFGEEVLESSKKWQRLLYVTLLVLLIASILIGIIIYWNRCLKKEVKNRTREIEESKAKLDQSDRFKGKVIDSIVGGIIAFDETGKVTKANSVAESFLEVNIKEGQTLDELGLYTRLPAEAFEDTIEGKSWRSNMEWEMKDGDIRYVDCSVVPIKGPDKIEGLILLIYDMTNERELYDLAKHNDKMQALGKLSAGVAHELRNPLTSIKAFIDMLPDKIDNNEFMDELTKIVPKEVNRLDNLVSTLLDYSKPKASMPQKNILKNVLSEIIVLLKQKLNEKKIIVKEEGTDIEFWADTSQFKQIMINILLNSIDAIKENGVISISGSIEGKRAIITVTDNGCGMSQYVLNKVFEPFFTSKKHGYGIGLSITQQLVNENRGEVYIHSEEGVGTSITINLPVAKPTCD